MRGIALLSSVLAVVAASPLVERNNNGPPSVTIKDGTLVGLSQPQFGQELFLNIPYADPPERLGKPQAVSKPYGRREATEYGPHCWSRATTGFDDNSGFENSEDCLTLNVVRPYGVFEGQEPVPVVVWIHGGGLFTGGAADYRYNATAYVQASVDNGTPFIFVSMNYRLASLGFMSSSQLENAGLLNLGFLDQRLALHWVKENIGKFGGDPAKVTIQGESAGGTSVHAQVLAYGGRDDKLFSQGIIQSAGPSGPYASPSAAANQATYNALLVNTTCSSTAQSSVSDQLACIRQLDIGTFRNATARGATGAVRDGSFIRATSPFEAYAAGKYVKIGMIVGSNTDEGQSFARLGANTTEQVVASQASATISNGTARALVELYPADPALGCPFDTGSFQLPPQQAGGYQTPGVYNKQVAAITNDVRQAAGPRWLGRTIGNEVPFYKYRFNHVPWTVSYGKIDYVGHFLEVSYVFNLQNNDTLFWVNNRFTATYLGEGAPINDRGLGQYMSRAFASFVSTGDPNKANYSAAIKWPRYSDNQKQIVWRTKGSTVEEDNFRQEGMDFIIDNIFLA